MTAIQHLLTPHERDLGDGIVVRRLLPARAARSVGPFVFLDHLGPLTLAPGNGMNVRPHPHIGLATATYLFEGEMMHRDSLGHVQRIVPGDVNWMTAGSGITHFERSITSNEPVRLHGIQTWVALPEPLESMAPAFAHHAADSLPKCTRPGVGITAIAGDFLGARSPVEVVASTLYATLAFASGASLVVPAAQAERAVLPLDADLDVDGTIVKAGTMAVLTEGANVLLHAADAGRVFLLGGAPLDGPRFMAWNFVCSSKDAIEAAKRRWAADEFPPVPGETERIPLPPEPVTRPDHS